MKLLFRNQQQKAFKELYDVIIFLSKIDGIEATDALVSTFKVAEILGVDQDFDRPPIHIHEKNLRAYSRWVDFFCFRKAMERCNALLRKPEVDEWLF